MEESLSFSVRISAEELLSVRLIVDKCADTQ